MISVIFSFELVFFLAFFHQTLIRLIDYSWILLFIWKFELINEVFSWRLTITWLRRSRKRLWRLKRHKLCSSSSSMIIQCHVSNSWLHRLLIILFVRSSDLNQVDQMSVQNKIIVTQLFSQKFFLNSLITWLFDKLSKRCNPIYLIFSKLLRFLLFSIRDDVLERWAWNKAKERRLKLNYMLSEQSKKLIDQISMLYSMQM